MGGRILSIICTIAALAGIVLLGIGYKNYSEKQSVITSEYAELSGRITDLEAEKRAVIKKMDTLDASINEAAGTKGTLNIIFIDMTETIYTDVLPVMTDNNFTGTLAVTAKDLPGVEGKLTDEQIIQMVNSGWKLIPRWSEGDGETGIATAEAWIRQYGYDPEGCVMIDEEKHTEEVEAILVAAGYNTIVIRSADDNKDVVYTDEIGDVWKPRAVGYLYKERKTSLSAVSKMGGHMAFTIGFDEPHDKEEFNPQMLSSMLSYLRSCENQDLFKCMNIRETRDFRSGVDSLRREAIANTEAERAEYAAELERIEKAIADIYAEYK